MTDRIRIQEPLAPYIADAEAVEARLFANGRSQAIRLPKQFRMPGEKVLIHREGRRLIIEPIADGDVDANGWPLDLWQQLDALASGEDGDFPDPDPLPVKLSDMLEDDE